MNINPLPNSSPDLEDQIPIARTSPTPNPPRPKGSGKLKGALHSTFSTIGLVVTAFSIAIILNTFVIQSYQVDGISMQQTLQNNDRLIVNKVPRTLSRFTGHEYLPQRGQIIIFNEAGLPGFIGPKQLIKRVIGLPGERVVVKNSNITIYNKDHPNGFNPDTAGIYKIDATTTIGNVDQTLQPDELFVCGDNRGNSEDSRYFGPIKSNQIVARLVLRILPLNQAKSF